jgi:hypothetical protein
VIALHGKLCEHGAGKLVRGLAWLLTLQGAHGLGELFQDIPPLAMKERITLTT